MENLSSNTNLTLLNLFIGMCRGERVLPDVLRRLQYKEHSIECKFQNSENETVQPELILASELKAHSLLFEWKAGANMDDDQLRRYSKITTEDLKQRALIGGQAPNKFDVTIIGLDDNMERLLIGIRNGQYRFPVLAASADTLLLKENSFACLELNQVFQVGLNIDWKLIPMNYVPFDKESDLCIIAEKVMQSVVEKMHRREPRIGVEDVASDSVKTWRILDDSCRQTIRGKIKTILSKASRYEFRGYLKYNREMSRKGTATWDVVNNPIELDSDKRNKGFKKINSITERFLDALKTGKHSNGQDPLPFPD